MLEGLSLAQKGIAARLCFGLNKQDSDLLRRILHKSPAMMCVTKSRPDAKKYNALLQHLYGLDWITSLKLYSELFNTNGSKEPLVLEEGGKSYKANPDKATFRVLLSTLIYSGHWQKMLSHYFDRCVPTLSDHELSYFGGKIHSRLIGCHQRVLAHRVLEFMCRRNFPLHRLTGSFLKSRATEGWMQALRSFYFIRNWDKSQLTSVFASACVRSCSENDQWRAALRINTICKDLNLAIFDEVNLKTACCLINHGKWELSAKFMHLMNISELTENTGSETCLSSTIPRKGRLHRETSNDTYKQACTLSASSFWLEALLLVKHDSPERITYVASLGNAWEFCLSYLQSFMKNVQNVSHSTPSSRKISSPELKKYIKTTTRDYSNIPWKMIKSCIIAGSQSPIASKPCTELLRSYIERGNVSDDTWKQALDLHNLAFDKLFAALPWRLHHAEVLFPSLHKVPPAQRYKIFFVSSIRSLLRFQIISVSESMELYKKYYPPIFQTSSSFYLDDLISHDREKYDREHAESCPGLDSEKTLIELAGEFPVITYSVESESKAHWSYGNRWTMAFELLHHITSRRESLQCNTLRNSHFHHAVSMSSFLAKVPYLTVLRGPLELCRVQHLLRPKNVDIILRSLLLGGYYLNAINLVRHFPRFGTHLSTSTLLFFLSCLVLPATSIQNYIPNEELRDHTCSKNACSVKGLLEIEKNRDCEPLKSYLDVEIQVSNTQQWKQLTDLRSMYRKVDLIRFQKTRNSCGALAPQDVLGSNERTSVWQTPPFTALCHIHLPTAYALQHRHAVPHSDVMVLHRAEDTAIISKPAGLDSISHDAISLYGATEQCPDVSSAVIHLFPQCAQIRAHGLLHRLDVSTSGLLAVALSPRAALVVMQQNLTRSKKKRYMCLTVLLDPRQKPTYEGVIRTPYSLLRESGHMMKLEGELEAETTYRILEALQGNIFLVECHLHTGRQHQIRLHMKEIGFVLLGDNRYGAGISCTPLLSRVALHACELTYQTPDGESVTIESTVPHDMQKALDVLRPQSLT